MHDRAPQQTDSEPVDIFKRPSWLTSEHPFTVAVSVTSVGPSRSTEGWKEQRTNLAGNMGSGYAQLDRPDLDQARIAKELTDEQKFEMAQAARENNVNFIRSNGYDPSNTYVMWPQSKYPEKLGIINLDDETMLEEDEDGVLAPMQPKQGDFIYTRDPEKVLGCRPADCPVLTIRGTDANGEDVFALLHVGWQGLNAGYLDQGMEFLISQGVDLSTLRIYVGPGSKKENYPYTNKQDPLNDTSPDSRFTHPNKGKEGELFVGRDKLFVDKEYDAEKEEYAFRMDMFGFIDYVLTDSEKFGLDPWQVAYDGSDTADLDSGYSSHSRVRQTGEINTRSLVIASMSEPDSQKAMEFMTEATLQFRRAYVSDCVARIESYLKGGERVSWNHDIVTEFAREDSSDPDNWEIFDEVVEVMNSLKAGSNFDDTKLLIQGIESIVDDYAGTTHEVFALLEGKHGTVSPWVASRLTRDRLEMLIQKAYDTTDDKYLRQVHGETGKVFRSDMRDALVEEIDRLDDESRALANEHS